MFLVKCVLLKSLKPRMMCSGKTYHFDIDLVPERRIRKHIVTMRESIQDQMGAREPRFTEVI